MFVFSVEAPHLDKKQTLRGQKLFVSSGASLSESCANGHF